MNKILEDKEIFLENNIYDIKYNHNLIINIKGKVIINDLLNNDSDIIVNLEPKSSLIYNKYNKDITKMSIIFNILDNTKVVFNQSIINTKYGTYDMECLIKGNNNNINLNLYGVTKNKGQLILKGNGIVLKKIHDNIMTEDIRILTMNKLEQVVIPNLLVSSNEVEVNHKATISSLNEKELFYLESKGLTKNKAAKLLINGFLLKKYDKELIKKIRR